MIPFHLHAPPIVSLEAQVEAVWRASGRTAKTIRQYTTWVRRFYAYCSSAGMAPPGELTLAGATRFSGAHVGARTGRHLGRDGRRQACVALRAWSCALQTLGQAPPPWKSPPASRHLPPLLAEFRSFRLHQCGVAASTAGREVEAAELYLQFLKKRGRALGRTRVGDLDGFVAGLLRRLAPRTVETISSCLRSFLRFLRSTGRLRVDLATAMPRVRHTAGPPKALPWPLIRRLVHAVRRDRRGGRRDFAMLLLMATYGLGAAEVMALDLDHVDWTSRVLRVRRPKTGVAISLPLLPAVARALGDYLEFERPRHAASRALFVSKAMPHLRISSAASLHYMVRKHARSAGVKTDHLGTHVFRHSYATRHVDSGTSSKVLGDILGHRHPASTSVYVRVALRRLRQVALPVPR